eukprot:6556030-Pyramimonas_sp.AAC.3
MENRFRCSFTTATCMAASRYDVRSVTGSPCQMRAQTERWCRQWVSSDRGRMWVINNMTDTYRQTRRCSP